MTGIDTKEHDFLIPLDEKVQHSRGRIAARPANVPQCHISIEVGMPTRYAACEGHKNDFLDAHAVPVGADICVQAESLARTYERPALRKLLAAFPADSKVAAASFAVMATFVSMSDKLPPAAAASIAEAAAFSSGNSPMANQSWWPKVKYHPMRRPPTLLKRLPTASSRFSGLANMSLTASEVKRPREM
jgi:hypothetical protein